MLIDGEAYFSALAQALARAERSVLVVGWDFHEAVRLERGAEERTLRALLLDAVRRRPRLQVHVLEWDYSVVFAAERPVLPPFRRWWGTPARIHFRFDGAHPLGGCHHQKLVVIDDAVAFCGGLDVTARRWDTRAHRPADPRRRDPWGRVYQPFHDVQMVVDGEAAAALGALARRRWQRATGEWPCPVEDAGPADRWPADLAADFRDVRVAIARTEPPFEGEDGVREIERLHQRAIAVARDVIYLENQYLTSAVVADALAARLAEPHGPEVILIGPLGSPGWLEERTMGAMRSRILARLRALPGAVRLGAFAPVIGDEPTPVMVHAKVSIIDDRLLRVGSANLSNRSMGLDTECDLAVEAADDAARRRIRALRCDLLAEHLGIAPERLAAELERRPSLLRAIERLGGPARRLVPIECMDPTVLDTVLASATPLDAAGPVDPEYLLESMGVDGASARAGWRLLTGALLVSGVALAWRLGPLGHWLEPERLAAALAWLKDDPAGPAAAVAAIGLASVVLVPITVLVVAAALLFGPWLGFVVALGGAVTGALLGYGLGARLWRGAIRQLAGRHLATLRRWLLRRSVATMAFVRLIPIAPFGVVNLVAGSTRLGVRAFALGTLLGMAPGTLALAVLADRVAGGHLLGAAVVLVLALVGVGGLARVLRGTER